MRSILRVFRREAGAYFASPVAYLFIGTFLAVTLFIVFWAEAFFARNIADLRPLFQWLPILLIALVATLTMRSWSEEHRAGTVELLMTSSASPVALVIGKFLAIVALVAVALVLTVSLPVTVAFLGPIDWGPVIGGYVASLLLAAAYAAIGLFVSARTDNPIVSLMVTALLGGAFYLIGTDWLIALAPSALGEPMRALGTGARFDEITRGVLDLRDSYYYISLIGLFLTLNVYSLERLRVGNDTDSGRRSLGLRVTAGLVAMNFLAANLWLTPVAWARADLTAGNRYTLGAATEQYLANLQQPLTLKAYISRDSHPLLNPLAPQLRDLLTEYGIRGGDAVRVEIVNPSEQNAATQKARKRYGIRPVPLQRASRYQSSVVSTYFHVVVRYGDQHKVLGLQDLIRVKSDGASMRINLDNPEYQITTAIRDVARQWRSGGNVFATIDEPVTFHGYISSRETLPDKLAKLRDDLDSILKDLQAQAGDKLTTRFSNPKGPDSEIGQRLASQYGFRPMSASLLGGERFYFHMVLSSGDRQVPVKLPNELGEDALREAIRDGLKRFGEGLKRTIAVYQPSQQRQGPRRRRAPSGPSYRLLMQELRTNNTVKRADLSDGRVTGNADLLVVLSPDDLGEKARYAVDQFLMRGGTVVIAGSPNQVGVSRRQGINVTQTPTGLGDWLARYGVTIDKDFVLDSQSGSLSLPTRTGGRTRIRTLNYPYFIDVRRDGMADIPMLEPLNQVTMAWMSPIRIDEAKTGDLTVERLIQSSPRSWTAETDDVMPNYSEGRVSGFPDGDKRGRQTLAVMLEGRFESAFKGEESPLLGSGEGSDAEPAAAEGASESASGGSDAADGDSNKGPTVGSVIEHSPASSRLIVLGSGNFLSDSALRIVGRSRQTRYTAPLDLTQNIADWSLEDPGLLALRGGGRYARPLIPLDDWQRRAWETGNYSAALVGLLLVFGIQRGTARARRRRYATWLNEEGDQ
jgi:ABC-2 type transport system permease protein